MNVPRCYVPCTRPRLFKIQNKSNSKLAISVLRINRKTLLIVLFVGILTTRTWTIMEKFIICRLPHFECSDNNSFDSYECETFENVDPRRILIFYLIARNFAERALNIFLIQDCSLLGCHCVMSNTTHSDSSKERITNNWMRPCTFLVYWDINHLSG